MHKLSCCLVTYPQNKVPWAHPFCRWGNWGSVRWRAGLSRSLGTQGWQQPQWQVGHEPVRPHRNQAAGHTEHCSMSPSWAGPAPLANLLPLDVNCARKGWGLGYGVLMTYKILYAGEEKSLLRSVKAEWWSSSARLNPVVPREGHTVGASRLPPAYTHTHHHHGCLFQKQEIPHQGWQLALTGAWISGDPLGVPYSLWRQVVGHLRWWPRPPGDADTCRDPQNRLQTLQNQGLHDRHSSRRQMPGPSSDWESEIWEATRPGHLGV